MADHQHHHAGFARHIGHQIEHLALERRAKGCEGLVQQHQGARLQQNPGQSDAALLPAGKCGGLAVLQALEIDAAQGRCHLCSLRLGRGLAGQREGEVLRDGEMGKQVVVLKQHGDGALGGQQIRDRLVLPTYSPPLQWHKARNHVQQRGFARP